jgi:hypothetical protein
VVYENLETDQKRNAGYNAVKKKLTFNRKTPFTDFWCNKDIRL